MARFDCSEPSTEFNKDAFQQSDELERQERRCWQLYSVNQGSGIVVLGARRCGQANVIEFRIKRYRQISYAGPSHMRD